LYLLRGFVIRESRTSRLTGPPEWTWANRTAGCTAPFAPFLFTALREALNAQKLFVSVPSSLLNHTPQCEAVLSIILPNLPPLLLHPPPAIPPHRSFPQMLPHSLQDGVLLLLLPTNASHADASTSAPKLSTKFMLPMNGIAPRPRSLQG
jgi:hypothetical protein